ncbi:hypothetical protein [Pseudomonas monteilii]|uniref:hypothetical protein n=1 Tax=Pseudomonas monteilii TaxID=76759 RepID=UPI001F425803|nr:hypothetical protein [Pseudomonas monteilii]
MPTENKIDCPAFHKRFGGYPYGDRVPRTVRMLVTVTSDRIPGVDPAHTPEARAGQTYPAWTNSHGAVVAVMDDGARLGLRPAEFEVDSWHHLAAAPAQQPHPEPIAWMVGTAFWWTKEEAERDAAATGLPIVAVGPIAESSKPADHSEHSLDMVPEFRKGEPVGMLLIDEYFDNREVGEVDVRLDSKACEQLAEKYPGQSLPLYTHADPGEVERLTKAKAFVQRLVDCAGTQPSVATGYLRDILDELKGNTTATAPVERDERAAFEHHHRICDLERDEDCPDYYRNQSVQDSWEGWQARAEQETRP